MEVKTSSSETRGYRETVRDTSSEMQSKLGHTLHCRCWSPTENDNIKGMVFIAHGFGEHLGWYEDLAQQFVNIGFLAFGHDHSGHGRSEGKRAYIENTDDYVDDILSHAARKKNEYQGLPLYIYGHSMGGMLAVCSVIRNHSFFKGMMLEGPLITPDPATVTPVRLLLATWAGRILPELQVADIRVEQVTSDREVQSRLLEDRLRWTGGFKLRLALALISGLSVMREGLSSITLPFIIQHGENDSLCHPAGSHLLYKEASSLDKTLKIYPTANHHLILEVPKIRSEVTGQFMSWLVQR